MASGLFNLKQVNQAISQGAWSGYIAPRWVEYLVVSGGGGGGTSLGGGGGAGGLLTGIVSVVAGTSYTVTVGSGGGSGASGVNSVFGSISATGGGYGGSYNGGSGISGGSGGGAGAFESPTAASNFGAGVVNQGNSGGLAKDYNITTNPRYLTGGGGGAGTVGLSAVGTIAGNGGAGIASAITGTVVTYAGGGGGSTYVSGTAGSGGVGGGGAGSGSGAGTAGTANTGGGGGGGTYPSAGGGTGGSGIVIVRYPGNVVFFTGGTVNYNNGYIIHIFTSNGTLAPTAPAPYNTSYQISRSLRFNSADSAYLNRTFTTPTNNTTWSFSFWLKRSTLSTQQYFLNVNSYSGIGTNSDSIVFWSNAGVTLATSTAVFRDVSAWYHVVVISNGTTITAYVNNSSVLTYTGTITNLNSAVVHNIGRDQTSNSAYLNGYMTEVNFVDGQALTPSSFGATSTTTGVWSPIQYSGSYGTNGFYLNFSDNSNTTAATLGKDYSGNGNNWTPNNFSVTAGVGNDSMVDSPTQYGFDTGVGGTVRGNYCTLNPLNKGTNASSSNGNLTYSCGVNSTITGTFGITSGKWYWEVQNPTAKCVIGIVNSSATLNTYIGVNVNGWGYYGTNGQKFNNGGSAYGATFTTTDVIGVAFDADAGTLVFYKNNTSQGTAFTGLTSGPYFVAVSDDTTGGATGDFNFGQRAFAYTAPSGFLALNTQNLPTPTIGATSNSLASQFFAPVTYTGNGSTQSITVGFQPDWVWYKSRSSSVYNHGLFDSVRGVTKQLFSNTTGVEATYSGVTAFNSGGFTVGSDAGGNESGGSMVAWNWRAGNNAGASNSAGSTTSTVSANTTSGFSIVTYTGTGANATVGHGLGVAPSMVIVKARNDGSGYDWNCYHISLGNTQYIALNTTAVASSAANLWNNTTPTSAVFSLTGQVAVNTSSILYVAYCFAEVAGYSKIGSYTGNGSSDGPFVYCGFKPRWILIKASSASSFGSWRIWDTTRNPYNVMKSELYPNLLNAEDSAQIGLDATSNGFKVRSTISGVNGSGETLIFMALAESPFKYSIAQ